MILVDVLMDNGWYKGKSCHLIESDNDMEYLDRFAATIGLKSKWRDGDHYDLVATKRAIAVSKGAREVTRKDEIYMNWLISRRNRKVPT